MNTKEIENIADLARLKFSDEKLEQFAAQFENVLNYIAVIENLNLEGVEPLAQVNEAENIFADDAARPSLSAEEVLKNAPKHNEIFFKVPKVLG
ncbi:MAG: Asp-tRNA(Asn)/Glu-tRNA(Gln) amidotransferase subunit GatC [Bacteroidota bacterium]